MNIKNIRVRFAPSPTGFMHLGNVRAALINYLFAKQNNGTFILRIEDTDKQRNIENGTEQIIKDLVWLNLNYNEGPYFQSERDSLYQEHLSILINKNLAYKCFCTVEDLEKKKQRQIALKMPPRYDKTCLKLNTEEIKKNSQDNKSFIYRFSLDSSKSVEFLDIAKGKMHFELKNLSDFALTRNDGSCTFIFANFVDDMIMKISHVFRGEDHLSNTANQIALYQVFNAHIPIFWHLPIIANQDGQKLSKRDFGFSLTDLKSGGYLPQAICNYLAIIGGKAFEKEIMSLEELSHNLDFEHVTAAGQIKYDIEKLNWLNHQWILKLDLDTLFNLCKPFIIQAFPTANNLDIAELERIFGYCAKELISLKDCVKYLEFYFVKPNIDKVNYSQINLENNMINIITQLINNLQNSNQDSNIDQAVQEAQSSCKTDNVSVKEFFQVARIALTGHAHGPSLKDILNILPLKQSIERLNSLVK